MTAPKTPPLILELFARLPRPGEEFPQAERLLWLRAAEAIFALIYKDVGRVTFNEPPA